MNGDVSPTAADPTTDAAMSTANTTSTPLAPQRWTNQGSRTGGGGYPPSSRYNDRFGTRSINTNVGSGHVGAGTQAASTSAAGFRRRPFNPRYYNGSTRSTFRIHRQPQAAADGATTIPTTSDGGGDPETSDANGATALAKPLFNEDDYTRITTPRQDVLFKKGYLSRPKPYVSSVDSDLMGGNGMEDVIVLTPEEAIAAGLMHGYDPENPYVGFYDATGMFYVNRKCILFNTII